MAEEVKEPEEVKESEQPETGNGELSEAEQDAIFNKETAEPSEKPDEKPEETPVEKTSEELAAEKEAEEARTEEERRAALNEDERKAEDDAKAAEEAKVAEEAEEVAQEKADKKAAKKAEKEKADADVEEARKKAEQPIPYEELMPQLREELRELEVPVMGKDGKPTDQTVNIGELFDTYEDDVVPLITEIMKSKSVRNALSRGAAVPVEGKPMALPAELIEQIATMEGTQNLMRLCMNLATPANGGHIDAYEIATSPEFGEWLGKQSKELIAKADAPDITGNREVMEAYKKEKGLIVDPAKKKQEEENEQEEEILNISSGGGSRMPHSTAKPTASEADLDKEFEEAAK